MDRNRIRFFPPAGLILSVLLTPLAAPMSAVADDWPFFRGPSHNGVSDETGWQDTWPEGAPVVAWEHEAGIGASSVVIQGRRVVTMGNKDDKDVVVCLGDDGSKEWEFIYPCKFQARMFEGGTASTPTISGNQVYTLSHDGQFHCIDLEKGTEVWRRHLQEDFGGRLAQWAYSGSPLVVGDMVIIDAGGEGASTLALHKDTGKKIWTAGDDMPGYACPIPFTDGRPGVLLFKAKHLVANALENGQELWRVPWETNYDVNASSPFQIGDKLFVSSGYSTGRAVLFQLTGKSPRELWRNDELKTKMSSCASREGFAYGITEKKARLLCLNLSDGSIAWEQRGYSQYGTLLIAGDRILSLTARGELIIAKADPARYTEISRAEVLGGRCWVNPALAHGRLYCKNNDGRLICLDLRPSAYGSGS